MVVLISKE